MRNKVTENKKQKLEKFVTRINEARQRGARAEIDLYHVCAELEDDGCWSEDGFRTFDRWLNDKHINVQVYRGYRRAIAYLGEPSMLEIGLSASREIASIAFTETKGDEKKAKTVACRIIDVVRDRIMGFRAAHGYVPSGGHSREIVRAGAIEIGIETRNKQRSENERAKLAKLLAALEQALEYPCSDPNCHARRVIATELRKVGFTVISGGASTRKSA